MNVLTIRTLVAVPLALAAVLGAQTYHQTSQWDLHASGGFDYLTPSDSDHRLYVAQGTQVVVMDTTNGKVEANLTGLQHVHGVALSPDGKTGYISDGGANKIVTFDTSKLKITGSIPTDGDNPDSLVIDPDTGLLFTFNGRSRQGVAINLTQQKVVGSFPVPGKPEFSQADGTGHVFVNIETTGQLLRIDTHTLLVDKEWQLTGCKGPSGLAIDRTDNRLFSVCDGKMAVTDAITGKQVALVAIGEGPDAVWYSGRRKLIFVSNGGSGTLSVIAQSSPDSYTVKQTLKTIKGARTMALDDESGTVYVIAPSSAPTAGNQGSLRVDVFRP